MAQYQILILPVLALALIVFFPIFTKVNPLSRSWRSARRRRTMLARIFVFALLIATFLAIIWPFESMNRLVQGVILTIIITLPFCLAHLFLSLKYKMARSRSDSTDSMGTPEESAFNQYPSEQPIAAPVDISTQEEFLSRNSLDTLDPVPVLDDFDRASVVHNGRVASAPLMSQIPTLATDRALHGNPSNDTDTHVDALEREWMEARRTKTADSSDSVLDSTLEFPYPGIGIEEQEAVHGRQRQHRESTHAVTDDVAVLERPVAKTTSRSTETADSVVKLKKLVAKQQAALNSERQAHLKTQNLTRKAGQLVRSARAAQKNAENAADVERSKRRLVEQQYERVAKALRDAMTVLDTTENQPLEESNTGLNRG